MEKNRKQIFFEFVFEKLNLCEAIGLKPSIIIGFELTSMQGYYTCFATSEHNLSHTNSSINNPVQSCLVVFHGSEKRKNVPFGPYNTTLVENCRTANSR